MLCPPAVVGGHSTALAAMGEVNHQPMDATADGEHAHADHAHAGDDASTPGTGEHHADGLAKCKLCCDLCAMTPLLSSLPSVPVPPNLSSVSFPDLSAPAPSFVADGQERPPRRI